MKLWTIIVTYQTPDSQLKGLHRQLIKSGIRQKEIFLKDNTIKNIGFAAAVNLGLKIGMKQGFQHFLVLNPDIRLDRFNLHELQNGFENFAVFGGVFKQNNKTYYGGKIDPVYLSGGLNEEKPKTDLFASDFVSGSFMALKSETIKTIGYLHEDYFLYYEDVDYCYRARKHNLKVGNNSRIRYTHFEASKSNRQKDIILSKSHKLFLKKYGTWWQKLASNYKLVKERLK